jgi:hypothetical protein
VEAEARGCCQALVPVIGYSSASWYNRQINNQQGTVEGTITGTRLHIIETIIGFDGLVTYRCKGDENADRFVCFSDRKAIKPNQANKRELVVEAQILMESALRLNGKPVGYRAQFLLTDARIVGE